MKQPFKASIEQFYNFLTMLLKDNMNTLLISIIKTTVCEGSRFHNEAQSNSGMAFIAKTNAINLDTLRIN